MIRRSGSDESPGSPDRMSSPFMASLLSSVAFADLLRDDRAVVLQQVPNRTLTVRARVQAHPAADVEDRPRRPVRLV